MVVQKNPQMVGLWHTSQPGRPSHLGVAPTQKWLQKKTKERHTHKNKKKKTGSPVYVPGQKSMLFPGKSQHVFVFFPTLLIFAQQQIFPAGRYGDHLFRNIPRRVFGDGGMGITHLWDHTVTMFLCIPHECDVYGIASFRYGHMMTYDVM